MDSNRLAILRRLGEANDANVLERLEPAPDLRGVSVRSKTTFKNRTLSNRQFQDKTPFPTWTELFDIDQMEARAERFSDMERIRKRAERFEEETANELTMVDLAKKKNQRLLEWKSNAEGSNNMSQMMERLELGGEKDHAQE